MNRMSTKRIVAVFAVFIMLMTLMPMAGFANDAAGENISAELLSGVNAPMNETLPETEPINGVDAPTSSAAANAADDQDADVQEDSERVADAESVVPAAASEETASNTIVQAAATEGADAQVALVTDIDFTAPVFYFENGADAYTRQSGTGLNFVIERSIRLFDPAQNRSHIFIDDAQVLFGGWNGAFISHGAVQEGTKFFFTPVLLNRLIPGQHTLRIEFYGFDDFAMEGIRETVTVNTTFTIKASDPFDIFATNSTKVAFGGNQWNVLGYNGEGLFTAKGDKKIALYLYSNLTTKRQTVFRSPENKNFQESPAEYANSDLQSAMAAMAALIPSKEQARIIPRSFASPEDGITGPAVANQKLWPLSFDEALPIHTNLSAIEAGENDVAELSSSWLRSNFSHIPSNAQIQWWNAIGAANTDSVAGMRPVCTPDISSLLFAYDNQTLTDAKTGDGFVAQPVKNFSQIFKFTFIDASQTLTVNATAAQTTQSASTLQFGYQNATTGQGQRVACTLATSDLSRQYYAVLADSASKGSGTLSIPLAGIPNGAYTLSLFSQQANGYNYSDFASKPATMKVIVSDGVGTVSNFSATQPDDTENPDPDHATSEPAVETPDTNPGQIAPSADFEGGQATFAQGSSTGLIYVAEKDFGLFTGEVRVDGVPIRQGADFTAASGSTRITLLPSYLNTLSVGSHTISVYFSDGTIAQGAFTVSAQAGTGTGGSPKTGDNDNGIGLPLLGVAGSVAAIAGLLLIRRKFIVSATSKRTA